MLYHFVILYVVYSTLCGSTHQTPRNRDGSSVLRKRWRTSSDLTRVQAMQLIYSGAELGRRECFRVLAHPTRGHFGDAMSEDATLLEMTRTQKDATCHRRKFSRILKCNKSFAKYTKYLPVLLTHSPPHHHHNPFPSLTPTTSHLPTPTILPSPTN